MTFLINPYAHSGWGLTSIPPILWLDAFSINSSDESFVNQWDDLSGNGRHAVLRTEGSRPVYRANGLNNKPCVYFNGTSSEMLISNVSSLNSVFQTFFIAAKRDTATGRAEHSFAIGSTNINGATDIPRWTDNLTTSQMGLLGSRPSVASTITNSLYVNAVSGGANQRIYTNGVLRATGSTQATSPMAGSFTGSIGSNRAMVSPPNYFFRGSIAALLFFSYVMNADEIQLISNSLLSRWSA